MSAQEMPTRAELTESIGRAIDTGHLNMRLQDDADVSWYFDTIDYSVPGRIQIEGASEYPYDPGVTITLAIVSVLSDNGDSLVREVQ